MFDNESNLNDEKEEWENFEYKWKEQLYNLFYEIKSETIGTKIEIDEEEYQENINKISIPKLITYIHDSIQILVTKKIETAKSEQKIEDKNYYENSSKKEIKLEENEKNKYENIIKYLEEKERNLLKKNFYHVLQKEAMENKIGEYMEMEDEFEEMKVKLKYEDGRFLNNDRKENEILIIRSENSNLKNAIDKLEDKIQNLENVNDQLNKKVKSLEQEIDSLKTKLEEKKQTELNLSQNFFYNITNHNHNLTKNNGNKSNCILSSDEKGSNEHIKKKVKNLYKLSNCKERNKDEHNNTVKYYRNQNMNLLSSQHNQLQPKILSYKRIPEEERKPNDIKKAKNNVKNEFSNIENNELTARLNYKNYNKKDDKKKNKDFPLSNSRIKNGKFSNFFNKNSNINNLYTVKKILANNSIRSSRPNSTKLTSKKNMLKCRLSPGKQMNENI